MSGNYLIKATETQKQCRALLQAQKQQRKFICERLLGISSMSSMSYIPTKKKLLKLQELRRMHRLVSQVTLPKNERSARRQEALQENSLLTKANLIRQTQWQQKLRTPERKSNKKLS